MMESRTGSRRKGRTGVSEERVNESSTQMEQKRGRKRGSESRQMIPALLLPILQQYCSSFCVLQ